MNDAPQTHPTTVNGNGNVDHHPITNGHNGLNGNGVAGSASPDSPSTPVLDVVHSVKTQDHGSLAIKIDKLDSISNLPQVGTPLDPDSLPIDAPKGTPPPRTGELLDDVRMAELPEVARAEEPVAEVDMEGIESNSDHKDAMSIAQSPDPSPTPSPAPNAESAYPTASTSYATIHDSRSEDEGRPAKRARKHSDADDALLAHCPTPPPESASTYNNVNSPPPDSASTTFTNGATPVPQSSDPSTLAIPQFRFCGSTVRTLKKMKDAIPFLHPVDPIALNIPHYPTIIKNPMDFSTVERKLASSNPTKPDANPSNPRYLTVDDFVNDVRLIFSNCVTFNGPDHAISAMAKRVEEVFDKQIKHMPHSEEVRRPLPKKVDTPPPPPPPVKKAHARRASTSVPVIRRSDTEVIGRPKREIHPPPPKDLPYADAPKKARKNKRIKDDGTAEQLKFCAKVLQDLFRKQHWAIASPFYEPVDWVKLEIPSYPKIVKKPMDLSTMKRKLDTREYSTAQKFHDDFKLMIRNCFSFNPAGTPVNQAGIELQRLFDDKWKSIPPLHEVSEDDDEDEDEDSEEDRAPYAGTIAMMESQIETMRNSITALKGSKLPKEKKKKEKREKYPSAPVASSSKPSAKASKLATSGKKKGNKNKPVADDDVLTFEQKKDLSEAIQVLDGAKLERVIQIIHEGVPEIRDSTEEIELEIDLLPALVLTKLYNYVLRPLRAPATKRNRTGKGTGTGGLKRKSMDEDVEAEKIRQLEERMKLFNENGPGTASAAPSARRHDDSEHSSDSSSGSDSSGSDSE